MTRIAAIPLAILASAWGFVVILLRWERAELQHFVRWLSPEMEPHWRRLFSDWRVLHNLKNLSTEWTRGGEQRASKFWAFLVVSGWLAFVLSVAL